MAERAGCSKEALSFEDHNKALLKFWRESDEGPILFSNKKKRKKWNRQRKVSWRGDRTLYVSAWPKWFAWRTNRPQVTRGLTADNEIHTKACQKKSLSLGEALYSFVERSERFWQVLHSSVRHISKVLGDRTSAESFFGRSTISQHAFCMGRYLCLEPILPVATHVAALWRSTCKPYGFLGFRR